MIWTTTPWTLPANVAASVKPDAEYGRLENGDWVAVALFPEETFVERLTGADMVGWRYEGPFDAPRPRRRGRPPDHPVGRGVARHRHRHRPHGARLRRRGLRARQGARPATLTPVDESGRFYPEYGWLHGISTTEAADQIIGDLEERGLLVEAKIYTHSFPFCWRCHTPLIFRLSDDWFIRVDEIRPQLLEANAGVEWTPAYMGKRMDDWLRNMGDWNISRRRYYGLPLPFYPCACGHLNVIGSRRELEARAVRGLDQLEELRRPWIDAVPIRCDAVRRRGRARARGRRRVARRGHRPLLDARLAERRVRRRGLRDRRGEGADDGRPARPRRRGRSGSPPTGCRRCASRSACGSTRSSSCPSRSSVARRSRRCSATRRCSTSTGARCTARGGT